MNKFKLFRKAAKNPTPCGPAAPSQTGEASYTCAQCGRVNPASFNFCPECGRSRANRSASPAQSGASRAARYLEQRGLLQKAREKHHLTLHILDAYESVTREMDIELPGSKNANDVMAALRRQGVVGAGEYRFVGWPSVHSSWGPDYKRVPAFVCELTDPVICLTPTRPAPRGVFGGDRNDLPLYGCPISRQAASAGAALQKNVRTVRYD